MRSLTQKRDVYVYLPPGYDPKLRYPVILLLHGFAEDEQSLLKVVPYLDEAIARQAIAADRRGDARRQHRRRAEPATAGQFLPQQQGGEFEDYVLNDVWDFTIRNYSIRKDREAHVLAGVSMGGFAAYNFGIRHRQAFGAAVGVYPALNLRWVDDKGNYMSKFDPYHWGWRENLDNRREVIASFYHGLLKLRIGNLIEPLFGMGEEGLAQMS